MKIHDFDKKLEESKNDSFLDIYENDFKAKEIVFVEDLELQKKGIDTGIKTKNGILYTFEEKIRFNDYNDMLFEIYSCEEKKTKGWATKEILSEFLIYKTPKRTFKIPIPIFKIIQEFHLKKWYVKAMQGKKGYRIIKSRTKCNNKKGYYTTLSLCVKYSIIEKTIADIIGIEYKPI